MSKDTLMPALAYVRLANILEAELFAVCQERLPLKWKRESKDFARHCAEVCVHVITILDWSPPGDVSNDAAGDG